MIMHRGSYLHLILVWSVFLLADFIIRKIGSLIGFQGEELTKFTIFIALAMIAILLLMTLRVFSNARQNIGETERGTAAYRFHFVVLLLSVITIAIMLISAVLSIALWGRFPGGVLG